MRAVRSDNQQAGPSSIARWADVHGTNHIAVTLTERWQREASREQLNMVEDALWLLRHALAGFHTEGPLTLPRTGLPVRESSQ